MKKEKLKRMSITLFIIAIILAFLSYNYRSLLWNNKGILIITITFIISTISWFIIMVFTDMMDLANERLNIVRDKVLNKKWLFLFIFIVSAIALGLKFFNVLPISWWTNIAFRIAKFIFIIIGIILIIFLPNEKYYLGLTKFFIVVVTCFAFYMLVYKPEESTSIFYLLNGMGLSLSSLKELRDNKLTPTKRSFRIFVVISIIVMCILLSLCKVDVAFGYSLLTLVIVLINVFL